MVYESMSSMAFENGYLTIMHMSHQKDTLRDKMPIHLIEMMEDGETFGWPVVKAYHAAWLQHLEQGRATCDNEVTRLKLIRTLVWHRIAPPRKPQPSAAQSTNKPTLVSPKTRACVPATLHIQLSSTHAVTAYNQFRGSVNTESFTAGTRVSQKTGQEGLKQLIPLWVLSHCVDTSGPSIPPVHIGVCKLNKC